MSIDLIKEKEVGLGTRRQWWKVGSGVELMVVAGSSEHCSIYIDTDQNPGVSADGLLGCVEAAGINARLTGGIDSVFVEIQKEDLSEALDALDQKI